MLVSATEGVQVQVGILTPVAMSLSCSNPVIVDRRIGNRSSCMFDRFHLHLAIAFLLELTRADDLSIRTIDRGNYIVRVNGKFHHSVRLLFEQLAYERTTRYLRCSGLLGSITNLPQYSTVRHPKVIVPVVWIGADKWQERKSEWTDVPVK